MTQTPLYCHVGAHRTGTSSFQMCLHENRQVLEGAGWSAAYPGRDGIPSGKLALRLPGPKDGTAQGLVPKAARTLRAHAAGRPFILSEENIPGRMMHFMQGRFYPAAEARASVLRAAWDGPIAHVLLVVRPYGQMFSSGFRKRAEDNPVPSFDTLRPKYMAMDRGWPALVEILRDVLRPDQLSVVPYAYRGSSADLLARLVPDLDMSKIEEPHSQVNVSATDAALEALQARYHNGESLTRPEWKAVIEAHANDVAPRGFAAFSEQEEEHWTARYDADLATIAAMDGVTFG